MERMSSPKGILLIRISAQEAEKLWKMQVAAFQDLYAKYQDPETSPATETIEKTRDRLGQTYTYYYYIKVENTIVGAIRIVDTKEYERCKIISPIFILKEFRGKGYAKQVIKLAEELHGNTKWELNTISQEPRSCELYEKLGYVKTGKIHIINEQMTLVYYKNNTA